MQVSSSNTRSLRQSNYALLRWFEGPQSQPREEFVEVLNDRVTGTVVRSSLKLNRETAVMLIGNGYTEEGVVQCCTSEDTWYLVTLAGKIPGSKSASAPDPGVLAVDDFLTEEQEAAILAELAEESTSAVHAQNHGLLTRPRHPA